MDAKLTKKRLSSMLTYDWLKIVGVAVAAIIFWSLVLTMTATRITPAQEFVIYNYYCNNNLGNGFFNHYNQTKENEIFSYEVIEINYFDLSTNRDYAHTMLQGHTAVDMGDVLFVPGIADLSYKYTDANGNEAYLSYAESFLARYGAFTYKLDHSSDKPHEQGYFQHMENYLNGYYGGDYVAGTLDTQKVETDFVARVNKNKDKRFKTNEQIAKGKTDDVKRIQKYRDALVQFNEYLTMGVVEFVALSTDMNNPEYNYVLEGNYAINLCPTKKADVEYSFHYDKYAENLIKFVSYEVAVEGEDNVTTAENMYAMFFRYDNVEEGFQYESLLYLNSVIAACLK